MHTEHPALIELLHKENWWMLTNVSLQLINIGSSYSYGGQDHAEYLCVVSKGYPNRTTADHNTDRSKVWNTTYPCRYYKLVSSVFSLTNDVLGSTSHSLPNSYQNCVRSSVDFECDILSQILVCAPTSNCVWVESWTLLQHCYSKHPRFNSLNF